MEREGTFTVKDFKNESGKEFTDISSEDYRMYSFPGSSAVRILEPLMLCVEGGGHRIWDAYGMSHYIPSGWIHLQWGVAEGKPNFVK